MLSDAEAIRQICTDYPQLNAAANLPDEKKACSVFYAFSVYAGSLILKEDWGRLGDCLSQVNRLYSNSSERLRTFIENIFIYKIGDQAQLSRNRNKLMQIMPDQLKHLMQQQFIASNI